MTRTFRKLDKADFSLRAKKLDPYFAKHGVSRPRKKAPNTRPLLSTLFGFGWIYFVISIGRNKEVFRESLAAGSLHPDWHDRILLALALLLVLSAVALLTHMARFLLRGRGNRGASGSILLGALGAMMLAYTPAEVMQGNLESLGGPAAGLIAAFDTDSLGIDRGTVALVFSREE